MAVKIGKKDIPCRILVLMSTYNGEKYLEAQIESILNQKGVNEVNLFIRDDGSSDGSVDIIEQLHKKYPDKIIVEYGENIGYNASYFQLLKLTKESEYDFFSFSDQDDVWLPEKLYCAVKKLREGRQDIPKLYASTSYLVHDDLIPYGTTRKKRRALHFYNCLIQDICPGHTEVFNPYLHRLMQEDFIAERIYVYDSWLMNYARLYGEIYFDNRPHCYYRQHEKNELGYGKGKLGQILLSIKRGLKGDGKKYRTQIQYFYELNKEEIQKQGFEKEVLLFLQSTGILQRLNFVFRTKFYRQSIMETLFFYVAVLLNKF
jgi:glycosyltransferase, family 2